jgi:DNA-binding CsgD family transcriptional regulator
LGTYMSHDERRRRREEILQFIREGNIPKEAADKFGLTIDYVVKLCHQHSVEWDKYRDIRIDDPSEYLTRTMPLAVLTTYRSGMTYEEIAKKLLCSKNNVRLYIKHLIRLGIITEDEVRARQRARKDGR